MLQLITARGLCEFDDVIHNTIGAIVGVGLVMIWKKNDWKTVGRDRVEQ